MQFGIFVKDFYQKYQPLQYYCVKLVILIILNVGQNNLFLMSCAYVIFLIFYQGYLYKNPMFVNKKVNYLNQLSYYVIISTVVLGYFCQNYFSIQENNFTGHITFILVLILGINLCYFVMVIASILPDLVFINIYLNYYTQKYRWLSYFQRCVKKSYIQKRERNKRNWDKLRYLVKELT